MQMLTLDQGKELVWLLMQEGPVPAFEYAATTGAHPLFLLDFLATMTGRAIRDVQPAPDDGSFYAIHPHTPGTTPPTWLQLITAATNEDTDMVAALVMAIANQGEEAIGAALGAVLLAAEDALTASYEKHQKEHPDT